MTKYVNGTIYYVEPISKEELKAAVNEIVVKGDKYVQSVGSVGDWVWPTNSGYTISSGFTYRINQLMDLVNYMVDLIYLVQDMDHQYMLQQMELYINQIINQWMVIMYV